MPKIYRRIVYVAYKSPKRMQNQRISIDPKQVITCSTRAFYMYVRETRENACPYQQTKLELSDFVIGQI